LAEYQEKFIERYELEQAELKYQLRTAKLESFQVDTTFINLREMSDSDFELYYNNQKVQHEAKLEAERIRKSNEELQAKLDAQQAEIDRKEREKKAQDDRVEREKKAESDRIQAEAERIEREKEKAQFEKEREKLKAENEKIQAEKKAAQLELDNAKQREKKIQDEKQKQIEAANKEAERLAKLGDSGKLKEFLNQLEAIDYPECKTKKNKDIIGLARERITKICDYLKTEIPE
jgi:hypothetical protein